jgi:hypothetical protein
MIRIYAHQKNYNDNILADEISSSSEGTGVDDFDINTFINYTGCLEDVDEADEADEDSGKVQQSPGSHFVKEISLGEDRLGSLFGCGSIRIPFNKTGNHPTVTLLPDVRI